MTNIQPLSQSDYEALFDFEQRNWDYFTQFIPARPDSYRDYQSFCHEQNILLIEQETGKIAFFVLYDDKETDKIIARVNLRDIINSTTDNISERNASMGYRVCQSVAGQGVATKAVKQLLEQAKAMQLTRINAIVMNNNPASKRVLCKNGFQHSHTETDAYEFAGQMMDFQHFYLMLKV